MLRLSTMFEVWVGSYLGIVSEGMLLKKGITIGKPPHGLVASFCTEKKSRCFSQIEALSHGMKAGEQCVFRFDHLGQLFLIR